VEYAIFYAYQLNCYVDQLESPQELTTIGISWYLSRIQNSLPKLSSILRFPQSSSSHRKIQDQDPCTKLRVISTGFSADIQNDARSVDSAFFPAGNNSCILDPDFRGVTRIRGISLKYAGASKRPTSFAKAQME
jgi:hypothetical protein